MTFDDWFQFFCGKNDLDLQRVMKTDVFSIDIKSCIFTQIKPLDEVSINDLNSFRNFVYDKSTECLIINFSCGDHEMFVGSLYNLISNNEMEVYDAAEFYVDRFGFLLSSVSDKIITIGPNYVLSPKEKLKFKNFKFTSINDHNL